MNSRDRAQLQAILRQLRSGNPLDIDHGERRLMQLAHLGPTTCCSCPRFPNDRSRTCWAHSYIAISVAEAQAGDGGASMRDIVAMIRKRTGRQQT